MGDWKSVPEHPRATQSSPWSDLLEILQIGVSLPGLFSAATDKSYCYQVAKIAKKVVKLQQAKKIHSELDKVAGEIAHSAKDDGEDWSTGVDLGRPSGW